MYMHNWNTSVRKGYFPELGVSCIVPGILLLASLSGIALVLFLQQKQLASNGHANGHLKGAAADGGTAFVEDETGLQVRRSKRYGP